MGHPARPGTPARARAPRPDAALGEPLRQPARDRRRGRARADAVVPAGAARDPDRRVRRERAARAGGPDRRRRARAGHGAAPRAARTPRLVRADRAERGAEPRLVDLRADHHLDGGGGVVGAGLRLRGPLALGAPLRRRLARARADGADRLRPPLRAQVRALGGARVDRLPDVVGARQGRPPRALADTGDRRPLARTGRRPRDGVGRLVDAARRRLHALLAATAGRRSSAPGSATSCRRCGGSRSAPCSCSRAT